MRKATPSYRCPPMSVAILPLALARGNMVTAPGRISRGPIDPANDGHSAAVQTSQRRLSQCMGIQVARLCRRGDCGQSARRDQRSSRTGNQRNRKSTSVDRHDFFLLPQPALRNVANIASTKGAQLPSQSFRSITHRVEINRVVPAMSAVNPLYRQAPTSRLDRATSEKCQQ
jgi:hypothetical protein